MCLYLKPEAQHNHYVVPMLKFREKTIMRNVAVQAQWGKPLYFIEWTVPSESTLPWLSPMGRWPNGCSLSHIIKSQMPWQTLEGYFVLITTVILKFHLIYVWKLQWLSNIKNRCASLDTFGSIIKEHKVIAAVALRWHNIPEGSL